MAMEDVPQPTLRATVVPRLGKDVIVPTILTHSYDPDELLALIRARRRGVPQRPSGERPSEAGEDQAEPSTPRGDAPA